MSSIYGIKEMKATIIRAGLPTTDILDRETFNARYAEALARLAEAERLRASRAPTPPTRNAVGGFSSAGCRLTLPRPT